MTSDGSVVFTPITNIVDAEVMRLVRNECREYMTKDTSYIQIEQQEKWFRNLDRDNIKMFLMHICYHGAAIETIGYGYCRHDGDETHLTGGIIPSFRGKGYGKTLFLHLIENGKSFNSRITLEVLNTNTRAKRLYDSIGFREIESDERITKMEYVDG
jgi:ribosomal protein S18 acetylase RimI-like enzyme